MTTVVIVIVIVFAIFVVSMWLQVDILFLVLVIVVIFITIDIVVVNSFLDSDIDNPFGVLDEEDDRDEVAVVGVVDVVRRRSVDCVRVGARLIVGRGRPPPPPLIEFVRPELNLW
jgi:hypothetical protein